MTETHDDRVADDLSSVRSASSRSALLPIFLLGLVVITWFGTSLILTVGPAPERISPTADLWPDFPGTVISEPSDRMLLIFWLFMGVVAFVGALWTLGTTSLLERPKIAALGTWALFAVLILLLVITLIPGTQPHDDWQGIAPLALIAAAALTFLLAAVRSRAPRLWPLINVFSAIVAVALLLAAGWQTHRSIRDPFHFGIALDDFLRGASLAVPYADYLPTYTALLGHPLFVFHGLSGRVQVDIAIYWVLLLQALALIAAFLLVRSGTSTKNRGIAALLMAAPIAFAQVGSGQSVLQSAPVMPSRVVLPLAAFVVVVAAVKRPQQRTSFGSWLMVLAGFLLGASAVNNVEFGATAVVAALVVVATSAPNAKSSFLRLLPMVAGMLFFGLSFLAFSSLASEPLDLMNVLRIQLIYAASGYDLHPLIGLGPYLPFVVVSLMAISIGALRIRRAGQNNIPVLQGHVLLLVGTWMLLSLGYFAGRSFTSVLFAGLAIQLGILLAVLAEDCWHILSSRWPLTHRPSWVGGVALFLTPVFFGLTLALGGNPPQRVLPFGQYGGPVVEFEFEDFGELRSRIASVSSPMAQEQIYLMVGPSAVTSRIAEMQDGTVMSRIFLSVSRSLMEFQCERLPSSGYLAVEPSLASRLDSLAACRQRLEVIDVGVPIIDGLGVTIYQLKNHTNVDEPYAAN